MKNVKFDFKDFLLKPKQSTINSRSEINVFYDKEKMDKKHLPIMAAPMDTVVSYENIKYFRDNGIISVIPRKDSYRIHIPEKNTFKSFSLNAAHAKYDLLVKRSKDSVKDYWCIDIANGHMKKLSTLIRKIKGNPHCNIQIMAGNVATAEGYRELSDAGADYVRCSIGSGSGCLTSTHTAIGYPVASLIEECYLKSLEMVNPAYIIADGGMKNYSDIIKALSLGADYVMMGGIFNKALESSAKTTLWGFKINQYDKIAEFLLESNFPLKKNFRGMSTKEVQRKWGRKQMRSAEGLVKTNNVKYTIRGWVDNFIDYLQSTMSYRNERDIKTFIGSGVDENEKVFITQNAYNRINK